MSSERSLLEVRGVCKAFGGVAALNSSTFDLRRGEILGVAGPNGSGKSTLVNCLSGFERKDAGSVVFNGRDITRLPAHRIADLGLVRTFQVSKPYYGLGVLQNIVVPLCSPRARRRSEGRLGRRAAVARNLLEVVGFERGAPVERRLAASLPTGYVKRVEIARCLALRPELVITDELFAGLTEPEIASMVPLVEALRDQGVTLIVVEPRLRELMSIADRIMVMNFGQKIAEGPPGEIATSPMVRAAYLGPEAVE